MSFSPIPHTQKANIAGFLAIILWSMTALVFTYCASIPSLLLISLSNAATFVFFLMRWLIKKENPIHHFKRPPSIIIFSMIGIGGYQLLYFSSLASVPVIEASLINYLWPCLIVLFTQFLPDHKIKWYHIVGAMLGFCGVIVLRLAPDAGFSGFQFGHIMALLAAIMWGGYSVLSRLAKNHTSEVVPIALFFNCIIFFILHTVMEPDTNIILASALIFAAPLLASKNKVLALLSKHGENEA